MKINVLQAQEVIRLRTELRQQDDYIIRSWESHKKIADNIMDISIVVIVIMVIVRLLTKKLVGVVYGIIFFCVLTLIFSYGIKVKIEQKQNDYIIENVLSNNNFKK